MARHCAAPFPCLCAAVEAGAVVGYLGDPLAADARNVISPEAKIAKQGTARPPEPWSAVAAATAFHLRLFLRQKRHGRAKSKALAAATALQRRFEHYPVSLRV